MAADLPKAARTRIAPTPSGFLQAGNAWSFLLTWLTARSRGGTVLLRIDDLDAARFREEYLEDIFASLEWLGLDWDEGPRSPTEFHARWSQRLRMDGYRAALDKLRGLPAGGPGKGGGGEAGSPLVYACACSREKVRRDSAAAGLHGIYPGTCRDAGVPELGPDGPNPLRLKVPGNAEVTFSDSLAGPVRAFPGREMGDFVIRQKNGDTAYQLASVIDDENYGIDWVVRGKDLLPSTAAQIYLADKLGCKRFASARFLHHDLILGEDGAKLSKSADAFSLRALREKLSGPAPLLRAFAARLGIDAPVASTTGPTAGPSAADLSAADLLRAFDPRKIAAGPMRWNELAASLGVLP